MSVAEGFVHVEPGERVLVLVPHSSGELRGCRGTLEKHRQIGNPVKVVTLAEAAEPSAAQGKGLRPDDPHGIREAWGYGQGSLVLTEELVHRVLQTLHDFQPTTLLAPSPLTGEPDHTVTAQAVWRAWLKATPAPRLWLYEARSLLDHSVDMDVPAEAMAKEDAPGRSPGRLFVERFVCLLDPDPAALPLPLRVAFAGEDLEAQVTQLQRQVWKLDARLTWVARHPVWRAYQALRLWVCPKGSRREGLAKRLLGVSEAGPVGSATEAEVPAPASSPDSQYARWLRRHAPTPDQLALWRVETRAFAHPPLISIVGPVHDANEPSLRRMVNSVWEQVYERWELCLINDASTAPHVRRVLDEYAAADPRIKVRHLERPLGTAGAANQALALATGEFVGFLDTDGKLYPHALFRVAKVVNENRACDLIYSDEDKIEPGGGRREPYFKPDWSPDLLLSMNYLSRFAVYRRTLLEDVGGLRAGFDGSEDYDLALRVTEQTTRIVHIPDVLFGQRKATLWETQSTGAKAPQGADRALAEALRRRGQEGRLERVAPGQFLVRYALRATPKVSIVIPMRNRAALTRQCLASIEGKSRYRNFEIVLIDNASTEPESLRFLDEVAARHRVVRYPHPFNFAAINNFGATHATGEVLLFLNNDIEIMSEDWLEAMLEHAQRPEVGAVGAKLLYPDGRIQHAGAVIFGTPTCFATHVFRDLPDRTDTYFGMAQVIRNVVAVTGACLMVRRSVFEELGGLDERLGVAFNDVDLCLRMLERGYRVVYTPAARLIHHESASRGALHPGADERLIRERWESLIRRGDPYYNPNITVVRDDCSPRV